MMITKRNGEVVPFEKEKIEEGIKRANSSVIPEKQLTLSQISQLAEVVSEGCKNRKNLSTEDVGKMVENGLMDQKAFQVARSYVTYRYRQELLHKANTTDERIMQLLEGIRDPDKRNPDDSESLVVNNMQRDYIAGTISTDLTKRFLLDPKLVDAHEKGIIFFHEAEYFAQHMHDCCLIDLDDMLQNSTVISETMIDKPKSFSTACNITTQIIAQVASSQYGGQSISLAHLAPFVQVSREKIRRMVIDELEISGIQSTESLISTITEKRVKEEINRGVQMIQYQVITLMTTNGRIPYISLFMYISEVPDSQIRKDLVAIIEELLRQRIHGVKDPNGQICTPEFPKLVYVLEENNVHKDSKYYYLTELAAKCTLRRGGEPRFISEKMMKKLYGACYPAMGDRAFLPYHAVEGHMKAYGRFNQGAVTLNLLDVAYSSKGHLEAFWRMLDERMELCLQALMCRHNRLKGTPTDMAPILWLYGALARKGKGQVITDLLYDGYSTISLGYAGLMETAYYMSGEKDAVFFAEKLLSRMNAACMKWSSETGICFVVYATPAEYVERHFLQGLKCRFDDDCVFSRSLSEFELSGDLDVIARQIDLMAGLQALSSGGFMFTVSYENTGCDSLLSLLELAYNRILYMQLKVSTSSDIE